MKKDASRFSPKGVLFHRTFFTAPINPDYNKEKKYSLRSVAEIIEQMEQLEENCINEEEYHYRRDYSQPRKKIGYLSKMPFAATSDPWFISPTEDLFDSPRVESVLGYNDIVEAIRSDWGVVKRSYVIEIKEKPRLLYKQNKVFPISIWQENIKKMLDESTSHIVIWGELKASLIRRNNKILEAYCMNLVGMPFREKKKIVFIILIFEHVFIQICISRLYYQPPMRDMML